jgi:hypothetical protein
MNEFQELLKSSFLFLVTLFAGAIGWFLKRHSERIDNLEKNAVTHTHLENTLREMREDRLEQHHENRASLERIEHKIDENEARASKTRHDTKDEVHALAMQLAVIQRNGRRDDR